MCICRVKKELGADQGSVSKWKTALNAVRAVQGMKQPSPPPIAAEVASHSQDSSNGSSSAAGSPPGAAADGGAGVAEGNGSKWSKALNAVKAANELKRSAAVGERGRGGHEEGHTPTSLGDSTDIASRREGEASQVDGKAQTGKGKWKTALSAVKAANGMQRMFAEHKLEFEQQPEDHSADFVGVELWDFVAETADLIYVPQKQRELIFSHAGPFFDKGMRSEHLIPIGKAIEAVFSHMLPIDKYGDKQKAAWDWLWSNISHSLGHELDVLEKDYNSMVLESWEVIQERADVDVLGQEFWKRLNDIAPDQTHIFR